MALDPNYLQSVPNNLIDMYAVVEQDILQDMARRIATYDYFIPAAQHQMQKLQELGGVHSEIIKQLAGITGKTQEEIVSLLTEAGEVAIEDDVNYYKAADVYKPDKIDQDALYQQLNAGLMQTQQAFFNITGTTANTATKQFERALDRAWLQISTGAFDYNTAIKQAITDLAGDGVGSIEYKSGRIDSIEVAVRRATVTGMNQTAAKTQEVLADELEVDLVEVTAHGGARPDHARWQGKVFSRNGDITIDGVKYRDLRKATGYGKAGGLCGINCRHTFHPYIPGAPKAYTQKDLKDLNKKDIEYNGEKYTEYEASQMQRSMEREMRKFKRQIASLEAVGEDASDLKAKLRTVSKGYTDFANQTGLKQQRARTKVGVVPTNKQAPEKEPPKADRILEKTGTQGLDGKVTEKMKDVLGEYTTGEYYDICEYSRYIVSNNTTKNEWFEKYWLADFDKETIENTKAIINVIRTQSLEDRPLMRLEMRTSYSMDMKVGDIMDWGIKSVSHDLEFGKKALSQEGVLFQDFSKLEGKPVEFIIEGKSHSLDISPYSKYEYEQSESLICGNYKITRIEEPKAPAAIKYQTFKDALEYAPDNYEEFTSKAGNKMYRYKPTGGTFKPDQMEQKEYYNGVIVDDNEKLKLERNLTAGYNPTKVYIEELQE